jgi:hypothetical protein
MRLHCCPPTMPWKLTNDRQSVNTNYTVYDFELGSSALHACNIGISV